jgi:hypothetical protein
MSLTEVLFSVPSFVSETASIFFHEECWKKVALERKKVEAKPPRPKTELEREKSRTTT